MRKGIQFIILFPQLLGQFHALGNLAGHRDNFIRVAGTGIADGFADNFQPGVAAGLAIGPEGNGAGLRASFG
jgi:hypothetical protein